MYYQFFIWTEFRLKDFVTTSKISSDGTTENTRTSQFDFLRSSESKWVELASHWRVDSEFEVW